jgi:hypothetical protein
MEVEAALQRGTVTIDIFQEDIKGKHGLCNSTIMAPLIPSRCSIVPRGRLSITIMDPIRMAITIPSALAAAFMLP